MFVLFESAKFFIVFPILTCKTMKKLLFFAILLLLVDTVLGASIHGTVYDLYLDKQLNAIVSVNSTPKQIQVAKEGRYSFDLPLGDYEIKAKYLVDNEVQSFATEEISIKTQGDYVLDLILFPSFEAEEELWSETEEVSIEDEYFKKEIGYFEIAMFVLAIAGLGLAVFLIIKYKKVLKKVTEEVKKTSEEIKKTKVTDEAGKVIEFIEKQGGRTTQKEIRKQFPSSEAKISLIISELEEKGVVKKIKKGRGNIIILR